MNPLCVKCYYLSGKRHNNHNDEFTITTQNLSMFGQQVATVKPISKAETQIELLEDGNG